METKTNPQRIALAMSLGSIIGAAIGGLAVGLAPGGFLESVSRLHSPRRLRQDTPQLSLGSRNLPLIHTGRTTQLT